MSPQMTLIADTPETPYYSVIFTSVRSATSDGYGEMADKMMQLAAKQPGFLGVESANQEVGITVSYWSTLDAIKQWRQHVEHQVAQQFGREKWYSSFKTRVAKVERDYGFNAAKD